MKKLFLFFAIVMASLATYAQNQTVAYLPVVYINNEVSVHFTSPEPIQYVDISSKNVIGDLPIKNVLRIKIKDSVKSVDAIVTVAGEKFIAQYHILSADLITARDVRTNITILPSDSHPLDIAGIGLSQNQLQLIANNLFCRKPDKVREHTKAFGIKAELNHIYSYGDYIFLDLGYQNSTHIKYDIDQFRFKIDDKKINKATNVQSVEVQPEFELFDTPSFKNHYRNIIVLKKMTFPGNKVLHIELNEKQLSGRVITLTLSYQDVLDADIIPL